MIIQNSNCTLYFNLSKEDGPIDLHGAEISLFVTNESISYKKICTLDLDTNSVKVELDPIDLRESGTYNYQIAIKKDDKVNMSSINTFFVQPSLINLEGDING